MVQIQINDALGAWLQEMAARAGKTPDEYAGEMLRQSLEDREDYQAAIEAKREMEENGEQPVSLGEVSRRLGLDD